MYRGLLGLFESRQPPPSILPRPWGRAVGPYFPGYMPVNSEKNSKSRENDARHDQ